MSKKIFITTPIIFFGIFFFSQGVFAASLNEQVIFNVDKTYDYYSRAQIAATLKKVGDWGYFYLDNQWFNSLDPSQQNTILTNIENLSREFDQNIYPKLTQNFGDIWNPGIDNDSHVTILVSKLIDQAGGYFNPDNEYPKSQVAASNQREMIYLNGSFILLEFPRSRSFLAHEFQHLITFYQKDKLRNVSDDVWLNEARSEYAPTFLGYDDVFSGSNLQRRVEIFLANPSDSLTEWKNDQNDYGPVNLFMQYLAEHYGGATIIKAVLENDKTGIASVNAALSQLGYNVDFSKIFTDWIIADYLNDCKIKIEYCYTNPVLNRDNLHIQFNSIVSRGDSASSVGSLKDWSAVWYEITPALNPTKKILELSFSSDAAADLRFKAPYIIQHSDGSIDVKFMDLVNKAGAAYIKDFGASVTDVIAVPSLQTKMTDFSNNEPSFVFDFQAQLLEKIPVKPNYPDGSLIRASDDDKIYIVNGQYKRWIRDAAIFNFYGQLFLDKIIAATDDERDWYQDSSLIRRDGDYKIYEVWPNGTKHWLNMTAEQFLASGRKFDEVYIVNEKEKNWYMTGAEIKN